MISAVIIALSSVPRHEQIERSIALADLIRDGEVRVLHDDEKFLGITDRYLVNNRLPTLEPALS
jgi:hypothetical protein